MVFLYFGLVLPVDTVEINKSLEKLNLDNAKTVADKNKLFSVMPSFLQKL